MDNLSAVATRWFRGCSLSSTHVDDFEFYFFGLLYHCHMYYTIFINARPLGSASCYYGSTKPLHIFLKVYGNIEGLAQPGTLART